MNVKKVLLGLREGGPAERIDKGVHLDVWKMKNIKRPGERKRDIKCLLRLRKSVVPYKDKKELFVAPHLCYHYYLHFLLIRQLLNSYKERFSLPRVRQDSIRVCQSPPFPPRVRLVRHRTELDAQMCSDFKNTLAACGFREEESFQDRWTHSENQKSVHCDAWGTSGKRQA